jgi:hypothetical protein
MYVFLVKRPTPSTYDEYDGFVAIAKSEEEARNMLPYEEGNAPTNGGAPSWPFTPSEVIVELIGKADNYSKNKELVISQMCLP